MNNTHRSLKRWLTWSSISLLILSLAVLIFSSFYTRIDTDNILFNSMMILILSVSTLIALISLRFENSRIFRRIILIFTLLLPVYIFVSLAPEQWINIATETATTLFTIGFILSSIAFAIIVFILRRSDSISGLLIIIFYLVICIILRQTYDVASNVTIVFGFFVFGPGMVMFGIRSLFILQKNNYLKSVTSLVCLLVYLVSWEIIWINPDSAQITLIIYSILIFLTTLVVLLSLPFSGYIQWQDLHKRILKKLIIPWIFVLLIVTFRFIFPDLGNVLFRERPNYVQEFGMRDYEIINKNGLEPGKIR